MKHSAQRQYDYNKWANSRVFNHLKELPDTVYDGKIESVFSSIEEVIVHVYQVDGMWLSVMSGNSFDETMEVIQQLKENSNNQDLDGMHELYSQINQQYESFFEELDDLDEAITIEHPTYGKLETPISDLVRHVVNHGTYHRGNITAMIRQQGHAGVPTDYVFYLNEISS